jgi:hypothetical protein
LAVLIGQLSTLTKATAAFLQQSAQTLQSE